jgi:Family of unknown function (DUF6406)
MSEPAVHRLGRRAQLRIGDVGHGVLDVGIMATSPDPADPAARVQVAHQGHGLSHHTVRPGDSVRVGAWTLTFSEIVHGARDGFVVFTAETRPPLGDPTHDSEEPPA